MTWGTPRQWRSIGGRPPRRRKVWVDTGSGAGIEVPPEEAHRFTVPATPTGTLSGGHGPAGVPVDVQVDAFRMLLARHVPAADGRCTCGRPLGEESGLCHYARQAQKALARLLGECP